MIWGSHLNPLTFYRLIKITVGIGLDKFLDFYFSQCHKLNLKTYIDKHTDVKHWEEKRKIQSRGSLAITAIIFPVSQIHRSCHVVSFQMLSALFLNLWWHILTT